MSIETVVNKNGRKTYKARPLRNKGLPAKTFQRRSDALAYERQAKDKHGYVSWSRVTIAEFAESWHLTHPRVKTGPTRGKRKKAGTVRVNLERLQPLIAGWGDLALSDIDRPTARRIAVQHPRAAVVARGMFQDAWDDGLIAANVFSKLQMEQSDGRKHHAPLTVDEIHALADISRAMYAAPYGDSFARMLTFTAFTGLRLAEGCQLERGWVDLDNRELHVRKAKFDKQRNILLLDEASDAIAPLVRRTWPSHERVFFGVRGEPFHSCNDRYPGHYAIWNPVRRAFLATLTEQRRSELVEVVWHSLRHFTGHHFYVTLDMGDELTAEQLGHSDAKLVRDLYGHGRTDALERMKRRLAA